MCWVKSLACVIALLLVLSASCLADDEAVVQELNIDVTHLPDNCADGRKSQKGDQIKMHYTGTLLDGTKFDSSLDRGQPMDFQLGVGMVIKGWDQGLSDMCVGEKRRLTIPKHLAYGDEAVGDNIPAGSTLVFETELMDIQDGEPIKNIFKDIDTDQDNKLSRDEVSSYLQTQGAQHGEVQNSDDPQFKEMIDNIMHGEDKDLDGFISHQEFSGPKHDEL